MKIVRIVPMFTRQGEVDAYIPYIEGFTREDEAETLRRIGKAIPRKKWAFVQNCLPDLYDAYQGILVGGEGSLERAREVRSANLDVIGYNLDAQMGVKEVLEQCRAVAVDVSSPQCERMLSLLRIYTVPATGRIALSVDSIEDYYRYLHQGFDYFIGDFYTRGVVRRHRAGTGLGPTQANKLAVLSEVARWEQGTKDNVAQIAQIIQRDVYLTLSLIKMANSSFFNSIHKALDLKDAIIRIGMENLTKWSIAILTAAIAEERTPEIARCALVRARFMEVLAAWLAKSRWVAFFTGLSSVSGVMLGEPLEKALKDMQAPGEVWEYLNFRGDMGRLYGAVIHYLSGRTGEAERFLDGDKVLGERLHTAYISAELWVTEILGSIDRQTLVSEKRGAAV